MFCVIHATGVRNDFDRGRYAYFVVVSVAEEAVILVGMDLDLIDENYSLAFEWMNVRRLTSAVLGILRLIHFDLTCSVVPERISVLHQSCLLVLVDCHLERLIHHSCY